MDMTFLDRILELAADRGWNQTDIELRARLPRGRISKWINGQGEPSLSHALAIAKALGVSIDSLADSSSPWPPAAPLTREDDLIVQLARDLGYDRARKRLLMTDSDIRIVGDATVVTGNQPNRPHTGRRVKRNGPSRKT